MVETHHTYEVAIVGAGPIGLELAAGLKRAGIDYVQFDKGTVGQTMYWWPPRTQWFSSNERIALAGIPLLTVGQQKATREEYLAYLRTVARSLELAIHTHESVLDIERTGDVFSVQTRSLRGEREYQARRIVLATGDTNTPKQLGIPGEDLPHVRHVLPDPHLYFQRDLLIIGGKNSAVEAALRCWHAGVNVSLSYRQAAFDDRHVKYWLLPEFEGRVSRGEIRCFKSTEPVAIHEGRVKLRRVGDGATFDVETDFVLLATGYVADMSLFRRLGVDLEGERELPTYDEATMETNVSGVYVAGTATAGTQNSYKVFLENCHIHVPRIVAHLQGAPPPTAQPPNQLPET